MNPGPLVVALAGPPVCGWLLLVALSPRSHRLAGSRWLTGLAAVGLGIGVTSALFFAWLVLGRPHGIDLVWTEVAVLAVLALLVTLRRTLTREAGSQTDTTQLLDAAPGAGAPNALRIAFAAAVAATAVAFALASARDPMGRGDGWITWNTKARTMFLAADAWELRDSPLLRIGITDYPLLVPATAARVWTYVGDAPAVVPAVVAGIVTFGSTALLAAGITTVRGSVQGLLAGLALAATPFFTKLGSWQYADVPVAFYVLLATVLLFFADVMPSVRLRAALVAGAAAGFAGWSKNEGLLFLTAVLLVRALAAITLRGRHGSVLTLLGVAAGCVLPLVTVLSYRRYLEAQNYLFGEAALATLQSRALDPQRYAEILLGLGSHLTRYGGFALVAVAAGLLYSRLAGVRRDHATVRATAPIAGTLAVMIAGHFVVYAITPLPLGWQIATSMDRLMLQLWPAFLFVYFVMVRAPDDGLANPASAPRSEQPHVAQ